jgi:putative glutamine amidotransferase
LGARPPLIGITTYGPDAQDRKLTEFHLPQCYVDAVAQAGGLPVLLTPSDAPSDETLARLDGLVLSGGGDLDPSLYGGPGHEMVYMINELRDRYELELAEGSLARPELAVLGICRGMQVMNIALGGDLDVHLPEVYGDSVTHRLPPREPVLHEVCVETDSLLERIYEAREFPVCSWHHQSVRKLGRDLVPIARASDGVIEGLVYQGHPWALGVQWHPEMQVANDPLQRRLFEGLVEAARRST